MNRLIAFASLVVLTATAACDRRTEPFVPGEKPKEPDLSQIFPEGADRAARPIAALPPSPGTPGQRAAPPVTEAAPSIRGTVTLAPGFADRVPAGAVMFLIARGANPGPPLAVQKITDLNFPLDFSIGPDDRMIAEMPFVGPVTISARIDADGNATTRESGDLQGDAPGSHQPGASGVAVLIDAMQSGAAAGTANLAPAGRSGSAGESIAGTIRLADDLEDRVPDGSILFLIARTAETGPPLAVQRIPSPVFPMEFSIGPDDRMIKAKPFAGEIRINARVDADANAMTREAGDLQGFSAAPHAPGAGGVEVVIDEVLPGPG